MDNNVKYVHDQNSEARIVGSAYLSSIQGSPTLNVGMHTFIFAH